jgi:DUF2075 family protein/SOS-response transcriptional repressor LexA
MIPDKDFDIKEYPFNQNLSYLFGNAHYIKDLWPVIYILSDGDTKEAYVGETTDAYSRMSSHLATTAKNKLKSLHLVTSGKFNKSATLDIESNLIKYISGDGQYKLINLNAGLANHNYYQKQEVYWNLFTSIWDKLRSMGIAKHSLKHINNSDLFKYSPYKTLTPEQKSGLLAILRGLLKEEVKSIVIEGGAGTGKTILSVFIFKLLNSSEEDFDFKAFDAEASELISLTRQLKLKYPNPSLALVVPMSSFRHTLKRVFKNIKGLKASMVVGPNDLTRGKFDIILVDEAHRLRRRVNLTNYKSFDDACEILGLEKDSCSELDWVKKQSQKAVYFYDENQSVKPSDAKKADFDKLKSDPSTIVGCLKSQFRVKGGNSYVQYISQLLNCKVVPENKVVDFPDYEFLFFDSLEDLVKEIRLRDSENGLSRLIAGYSWEWISKKDKKRFDIEIENVALKWNSEPLDWVNSENAVNEVGCIHTTQGYDLNYTGIIFGKEISYDKARNEIVILKENYFDKGGKNSIENAEELKCFIINIYKTILLRGIKGTYVYACDEDLRAYLSLHIPAFKRPKENTSLKVSKVIPLNNSVPLYDLKAAAGSFSKEQKINDQEWVSLPAHLQSSEDLFACAVEGESMNKIIPNGSVCLFRKYRGGSRHGKIVLVEYTGLQDPDSGSCYTVKEYQSKKILIDDTWRHQSITLLPLSHNSAYEPIVVHENELEALKVIGIFEQVLF